MPESTGASPRAAAYLLAARSALDLAGRPDVAARWAEPSDLSGMTVGGVTAHLLSQILAVRDTLAGSAPGDGEEVLGLREHYRRAAWRRSDEQADQVKGAIRSSAETHAGDGPQALLGSAQAVLAELEAVLPDLDPQLVVRPAWLAWALRLDDFLLVRTLEIVVHGDDLVASVGLEPVDLPTPVVRPVLAVLLDLAVDRHGQAAVLRALARRERAPETIAGL